MTAESLPLPFNVIHADPLPTPIIPHIHDHEEVCTSACPASPDYEPDSEFSAYEVDGQRYIAHDGIQWVPVSDAFTLHLLAGKIDRLEAQQENIAAMLATVVEMVGPTLDKLTDHPMLKMFLGGK